MDSGPAAAAPDAMAVRLMATERLAPGPEATLVDVGGLRWFMPVTLERLYENLLDWQRLPCVHGDEVATVSCRSWGAWGWCADVEDPLGRRARIEVNLDRGRQRWTAVWRSGPRAGWRMEALAEPASGAGLRVTVRCLLPSTATRRPDRPGRVWAAWLERFCAADEAMMVERQRQLERRIDRAREAERHLDLGPVGVLPLPSLITLAGREFVVAEVSGRLRAFPARCPHQLGPLLADPVDGRTVRCPWHGDRFDVLTGENLSGRPCALSHLPEIRVDAAGHVQVSATH